MRTTLDRKTVIRAAMKLLADNGLDGLSLRNVASELGVRPGALYWHFANKQELLDQMAATLVEGPLADLVRPRPGQSWDAWLAARARAFRTAVLATRDGARLVAASRPTTDRRPEAEAMVATLTAAGFAPADALRALTAVKHYIVGAVQEEQDYAEGRAVWPREADPDRYADYPELNEAMAPQTTETLEAQFEYGLRALLRGLAP
ncbi:TetR/AcrR family transcriptional regulator C-terminal domain-containing protein [Catenulispora subtropica]|uniref:Tetracycline resistance transcriptional repressor TetR(A) n=1 Tax=Catenulispora subtropica TaxID=450798 RepID=A0ABN2SQE0_9ACTN